MKHIWKIKRLLLSKKEKNAMKSQKVDFQKSQKLLTENLRHPILLLFHSSERLFFEMCLLTSTIAKLCPCMIHFDALDFSECRSEEVISFFWRSVYR